MRNGKVMTPTQYRSARSTLELTHDQIAEIMGKSQRQVYRYSEDGVRSQTAANLIRVLVHLKLTASSRKFNEMIQKL